MGPRAYTQVTIAAARALLTAMWPRGWGVRRRGLGFQHRLQPLVVAVAVMA